MVPVSMFLVCVYVCMCVYVYTSIYIYIYICMHVCMYRYVRDMGGPGMLYHPLRSSEFRTRNNNPSIIFGSIVYFIDSPIRSLLCHRYGGRVELTLFF